MILTILIKKVYQPFAIRISRVSWGGWREKATADESKNLQARMIDIITGPGLIRPVLFT